MKSFSFATLALLAFAVPAAAQHVASTAGHEERRIIQGERSGELSRGEALRLQAQQNRIDATIARERAQNGGYLTAAERIAIQERQQRASINIYREKHNDIVR